MKILIGAYFLDLLLGDPQGFPHPVRWIGNLIISLEKRLLDLERSKKHQFFMGGLLTVIVVASTYLITLSLIKGAFFLNNYLGISLSIILGYTVLATKSLDKETRKVYEKLETSTIEEARTALSYIVGRETKDLEEKEIVRATVETIGENISDGVIAPMLYLVIGGVPLAMAYKAINTLDSMVGYKNDKYLYFGRFSAKLDDIVNYIPARLTAIFIVIAAFFRKRDYMGSIKTVISDGRNHSSPNAGYPEAAVAGALRIQLGGINKYFGKEVFKPTIGKSLEKLSKKNIIMTIDLMYWSSAIAVICFSALNLVMGGMLK
ncbi:adenosylcobinamide-phosphate synthase [Natronincola peptidivorans]|uniref:Cobalamin biosynthesis protein CobD n=1 Tax=Natronincola peptidivorans TaxID=426128 RepID=A0A1I0DJ79_9FIRM|nr:adenosylcobinamide-phosphate synthase CbiB [Natronincola peptidivorans]SET32494.1 adenosylcobinamide-phosphate synthase [Natronincola peptidivorans]